MLSPGGRAGTAIVRSASPLPFVVAVLAARNVLPELSWQVGLVKTSTRNDVEPANEARCSLIVVVPPAVVTDVIVGGGWERLPPFSRSIPSFALSKIVLRSIASPTVVEPSTRTPCPPLKAPPLNEIVFPAPATVPPTTLPEAPFEIPIPAAAFETEPVPDASVPTKLPWTRL